PVMQRMSAASLTIPPPALPAIGPAVLELDFRERDMSPIAGAGYTLTFENGSVLTGRLDENGYARHENVPDETANVRYELPPPKPEPLWEPWQSLLSQADTWLETTGDHH
ncbi:type VI secretion system tip protein VgrG, partial [Brenneria populi subsp. brevivirga]|nr:type VI secretion system tip protein VgrG [Brenneria populi subsp. brevivirga]